MKRRIGKIFFVMVLIAIVFGMTLVGCEKKIYTVTFDHQYNSIVSTVEAESGSKVTKPSDPVRAGYIFSHWYLEDESQEYDFNKKVKSNITLKAKWEEAYWEEAYRVSFVLNGGTMEDDIRLLIEGSLIAKPITDPIREGYAFIGWYYNEQLTENYIFDKPIERDVNIYAKWHKEVVVNYYLNFKTGQEDLYFSQTELEGDKVTLPADPTRENFVFTRWYLDADNTQEFDLDTLVEGGQLNLYAGWDDPSLDRFSVKFYDADGTLLQESTVIEGCAATPPIVESKEEYYRFAGFEGGDYTNVVENLILTATYELNTFDTYYFDFILNDESDGYIITDFFGELDDSYVLVLPDSYNNLPVVGILDAEDKESGVFASVVKIGALYIPSTIKNIGDYAFMSVDYLNRIVLNEGLERIGKFAFAADLSDDFDRIIDIHIPSTVKIIDDFAFFFAGFRSVGNSSDHEIVELTFAENSSLERIGISAFDSCTFREINLPESSSGYIIEKMAFFDNPLLERISLSASITEIDDFAFRYCGTYFIASQLSIRPKDRFAQYFPLPKYITDGFNVVTITIPEENSLTRIGDGAFEEVRLSGSLTLRNITDLDDFAFRGHELNGLLFEKLKNIGDYALYGRVVEFSTISAGTITTFESGENLEYLGYFAFENEKNITEVDLSNAKVITSSAFFGSGLTSVVIPDSLTEIGAAVFWYCRSLTSVVWNSELALPDTVFGHCSELISVVINNAKVIGPQAFTSCQKLSEVILPDALESIGDRAFQDCKALREITLPDSLLSLGNSSFKLTGLRLVTLPANITQLPNELFNGSALVNVIFKGEVTHLNGFRNCHNLRMPVIPDTVKVIGEECFAYTSLGNATSGNIILPSALEVIGLDAFVGAIDIRTVTIKAGSNNFAMENDPFRLNPNFEGYIVEEGNEFFVTDDHNNLYSLGYEKLIAFILGDQTSYTAPEGLKEIGARTFNGMTQLVEIKISSTVEIIGDEAFAGLRENADEKNKMQLSNIDFSEATALREIGYKSFVYTDYLATIDLSTCISLEKIGKEAFSYAKVLQTLILPANLKIIGEGAFKSLAKDVSSMQLDLSTVTSLEEIGNEAFINAKITSVKFPASLKIIGDRAFFWHSKDSILRSVDFSLAVSLEEIGNEAFSFVPIEGTLDLTPMTNLVRIGTKAFWRCNLLTGISFPNNDVLTEIGDKAFAGYDNGSSAAGYMDIRIVDLRPLTNLKKIGKWTFAFNVNLEEVYFPVGLEEIGRGAFTRCAPPAYSEEGEYTLNPLTQLNIPYTVKTIGEEAFCTNMHGYYSLLEKVYIGDAVNGSMLEYVNHRAFGSCNNLKEVYIYATMPPKSTTQSPQWKIFSRGDVTSVAVGNYDIVDLKIYVPKGALQNYLNAEIYTDSVNMWAKDHTSQLVEMEDSD